MPIIVGVMILAGTIVLLTSVTKEEEESKTPKKESDLSDFNIEEVRRLRKQLRQQLKAKKRSEQKSDPQQ
jgi:hypothetical protein